MFTAYYLRRAVGRANFITGEPESAPVSPPLDRQEQPSVFRTRVAGLSTVERAFRSTKSVDLKVRSIYVLLCTPAYYVEWHMRAGAGCYSAMRTTIWAQAQRTSLAAPAQPSESVREKVASEHTTDGPQCTASAVWFAGRPGDAHPPSSSPGRTSP